MLPSRRFLLLLLLLVCVVALKANPAPFIENKGQWEQGFDFSLKLKTARIYFFQNHLLVDTWHPNDYQQALEQAHHRKEPSARNGLRGHTYTVHFVNSSKAVKPYGIGASTETYNFFLGNDPARWKSNLHGFGRIHYPELWKGIDLEYKIESGRVKYDLHLAPGCNPADIQMQYKGLDGLKIRDGKLILEKTCGNVTEMAPVAWQWIQGKKINISCNYVLKDNIVSYHLGPEYRAEWPLTIDPEIIFSTYSGSTGDNWASTATYDDKGNAYMGGMNFAPGYPVSVGAYQTNYISAGDVTISKFTPNGSQAIYHTYLGGSLTEIPYSMIVDSKENLLVMGSTGSANFPISTNAAGQTFRGGASFNFWQTGPNTYLANYPNGADLFVAKLSANGRNLLSSTFLGGSKNDGLNLNAQLNHNYGDLLRGEIITDPQDNVYVIGTTESTDLPVVNAWQSVMGGARQDACFFKLDEHLSTLKVCSYFGGPGEDSGYGMALDGSGNLYFCGGTSSQTFAGSAALNANNHGAADGYLAMVNANGGPSVRYCFLGSSGYDQCYFVQVDNNGDVVTLGQTSGQYPVQQDGNKPLYTIADGTLFFHKLNNTLDESRWSTRFGTSGTINHLVPTAFLVDYCNFISFALWAGDVNYPLHSTTAGLPVSTDAFQGATTGSDFYLGVLKDNASALHYGTFFGGTQATEHVDGGTSRFDKKGIIYQSICAGCGPEADDLPITPGVWSATNNSSNCNAAVFKFDLSEYSAIIESPGQEAQCAGKEIIFSSLSTGSPQLSWDFGDGSGSNLENPTHTYQDTGTYLVKLIAKAQSTCVQSDTARMEVKVEDIPKLELAATNPVCRGDSLQLQATGALHYQWFPAQGLAAQQAEKPNPMVAPQQNTIFKVKGSNHCGADTAEVPVYIIPFDIEIATTKPSLCIGEVTTITANSAAEYHWYPSPLSLNPAQNQATYAPALSGLIRLDALSSEGCKDSDSMHIEVLHPPIPAQLSDTAICYGDSILLHGPNAQLDTWSSEGLIIGSGSLWIKPFEGKTYLLEALNQCGSIHDTMQVVVHRIISETGPRETVCLNDTINVYTGGGTSYAWSPAQDFLHPTQALTQLVPRPETVYTVTIQDENTCRKVDTLQVNVFKQAYVNAGPDQFIVFGDPVRLNGKADPGEILWKAAQKLSCDTCLQTLTHTDTTASFVLQLTDQYGCKAYDTLLVQVEGVLYLPNTFTPNQDGLNDTFGALYVDVMAYRLEIFNRWGEKLFTSTDPNLGWDGSFKGEVAQDDLYTYRLRFTLNSGKEGFRVGRVLLLK